MIRVSDMTGAWSAALAMARGDDSWADKLDMSAQAVFRSFWALGLAVPAFIVSLEAQRRLLFQEPTSVYAQVIGAMPTMLYFGSFMVIYLVVWAAEMMLLVGVGQRRGVGWKISPLIIIANWLKFIYLATAAIAALFASVLNVQAFAGFGSTLALATLIYFRWGLFRQAMELSPRGAAGMTGAMLVVNIAATAVAFFVLITILTMAGGDVLKAMEAAATA